MTTIEIAGLLRDYGPVGLNALLLAAVVILYKAKDALHNKIVDILTKSLIAIEASTAALVESRGSLQALSTAIEALGKATGELTHESENHDREVRHGLNNVSQSLIGLRDKLGKICDQIDKLLDHARGSNQQAGRPR